MKKLILIAVLTAGLMANDIQVAEAGNPNTVVQYEQSVNDTNASVNAVQSEGEPFTARKALVYAATPVVIAGAIVAAIVISPIIIVKKIFGN